MPQPKVVKTSDLSIRELTIDEAAVQLDLMNNDFLVFRNAETRGLNVIYRRKEDGKLGLLEAH